MIIFPAIDLLDGKCVRLYQGDYARVEQVANDAEETAKRFLADGATHLHVVDLNGAKDGGDTNFSVIERLARLGLKVETGGGIRNMARIARCFDAGVENVILGSAAVEDEAFLMSALAQYKERIIVGLDALNGTVRTAGWLKDSGLDYIKFAKTLEACGVQTVVYTDISKDGTLQGVHLEGLRALGEATSLNLIASGGVATIEDIRALNALNVYGAICGKSIYARTLSLKEAIAESKRAR